MSTQIPLDEALRRLTDHVVAQGGSISVTSGMDGFYRSLADDGPVLKLLFQKQGGVKQALKKCSSILTYVRNKDNSGLSQIVVEGMRGVTIVKPDAATKTGLTLGNTLC